MVIEALAELKLKARNPMSKKVKLQTYRDNQLLEFSGFELYSKDSLKCRVSVNSDGFCVDKELFFDNATGFLEKLIEMEKNLSGTAEIREDYKDHFIRFSLTSLGHLIVSGEIYEYSEHSQSLLFSFETDQTCLKAFIQEFGEAIGYGNQ